MVEVCRSRRSHTSFEHHRQEGLHCFIVIFAAVEGLLTIIVPGASA
jgi:hypothetical protein